MYQQSWEKVLIVKRSVSDNESVAKVVAGRHFKKGTGNITDSFK